VIYAHIEDTLNRALALVGRVSEVYRLGGPQVRRLANQCFFDKLLIAAEDTTTQVAGATLREPWATLLAAEFIQDMTRNTTNPGTALADRGSKMMSLVPPAGHAKDGNGSDRARVIGRLTVQGEYALSDPRVRA
jgi:hypothetical protein